MSVPMAARAILPAHGSCAARGATGEESGVAGWSVSVVGVFAGDAVGELMKVSFAGDDRARIEKALGDPGVSFRRGMVLLVEAGAAAGDRCQVEAVFDRDGNAVKRWTILSVGKDLG